MTLTSGTGYFVTNDIVMLKLDFNTKTFTIKGPADKFIYTSNLNTYPLLARNLYAFSFSNAIGSQVDMLLCSHNGNLAGCP